MAHVIILLDIKYTSGFLGNSALILRCADYIANETVNDLSFL